MATKKNLGAVVAGLRNWNVVLFCVYLVQGGAILLLSTAATYPVTVSYLTTDTLQSKITGHSVMAPAMHQLFTLNMAYVVAAVFFLAALAHLLLATGYRPRYERKLKKGQNRLRWIEYALSGGLMVVTIAVLSGMYDAGSLLLVFVATAVMSLLGLVMELHNPLTKRAAKPNWLSYIVGAIVGVTPWVVIAGYLVATNVFGNGHVTPHLWALYGTIVVCFVAFAANMYVQYIKKGKWADYVYGERCYMILSLVAKTALAWQVFAAVLHP